jgi:hypothetical protein
MSKPKIPKAPDYTALANQQAALSQQAVNKQTQANRPTQVSGEGTVNWTKDAKGNWTQNATLNPTLAGAQQSEQATRAGIWDAAQGAVPGATGALSQPWDTSGAPAAGNPDFAATQNVIDATYGLMAPELERQRKEQEAQMVAQGLRGGEEAYGRSQYDLGRNENDARMRAILAGTQEAGNVFNRQNTARQNWLNESLMQRELPVQELTGLMGLGGHVSATPEVPGFASAGLPQTPDIMQAGEAQYNADLARANAQNQGGFWNGLMKLGSTALGSYMGGPGGAKVGDWISSKF